MINIAAGAGRVPPQIAWPVLPAAWLESVSKGLPALARDVVDTITTEIPEYRNDPHGLISVETKRHVGDAVETFVRQVTRAGVPASGHEEQFRRLGRFEAEAGRSHDTVQLAYRLASRTIMRHLLAWERQYPLSGDTVARLSTAIFAYIDDLAALSAEGYQQARSGSEISLGRARLLTALLDRASTPAELADLARRLEWPVPEAAAVLEVVGLRGCTTDALAELAVTMAGVDALAADISGRHVVLAVEPVDDDRLDRALRGGSPDALAAVGFRVAIADIAESYRWAHRACGMRARGLLGTDTVVRCDRHAVSILADAERVLHEQLMATRLAPIASMSLAKRLKYGRLLSAWLELGSTRGDAPGVLDKHRQTLRYQITRLEQLFGDQLADREARVEIVLALRAALPRWEQETTAANRLVPQPRTTATEPR